MRLLRVCSALDVDARDRVATAGERAADLVVADLARHLDDGVIAVQVDFSGSAVNRVECLLDAGLAVAASHALDVDNLRLDDRAREFLFRHLDVSAAAAAALPAPVLDDAFEGEVECHKDNDADDCCSHDGFLLYRDESVSCN